MNQARLKQKAQVMDDKDLERCITRMAHEIVERNKGVEQLAIIGMRTRGYHIACRVAKKIVQIEQREIPVGALDVTFYRDDFRTNLKSPGIRATEIHFSVEKRHVILVDDVLFTGRTVRAALDELNDLGRAQSIELAVLVDRGHREMPIRADYVGKNIPTAQNEEVEVKVTEEDGCDGVWLMEVES